MIMQKYLSLWLMSILMLACSCRSNGQGQSSNGNMGELPLPEVPATLTTPEERAAYILEHFWDGMDFSDTLRSRDSAYMEQNLVNFLSLFPHVRQEALPSPVGNLLRRAAADSAALRLVCGLVDRYLNDPNSPMRNEDYYVFFLEELLRLPGLSEYERVRPRYQLATVRKNRPGTVAADFSYMDRHGMRNTLHATRAKRLLLLFYDPACSHCSEILDGIRGDNLLARLVANKELAVLAVYTEGDRALWDATKDSMPQEWTVAIDESGIVERELYSVPAMPVIYLLDNDKTVLLKDARMEEVLEWAAAVGMEH